MTDHTNSAAGTRSRWPGLDAPLSRDPLFWASVLVWGAWIALTDPMEAGWVTGVILLCLGLPSAMFLVGTLAGAVRAFTRGLR